MNIPFNNLKRLHERHQAELEAATQRVLDSGWFILGPEVEAFEAEFAAYHGVKHAVGVANGTDALELALRAADIGAGDEVITVAHTAIPTVYAIERTGATVVFADIDATCNINPADVVAKITPRTKAIIPVHLYGNPADMTALTAIAADHGLLLLEDCAQAHGAKWGGQLVGTFGQMAAFSFYPTKNLGAYGDGGAIITGDSALADRLRRLRNYGQTSRYISAEIGVNSRLDELQAAILRVKLAHLDDHNAERRQLACDYVSALSDAGLGWPSVHESAYPVYHLYVLRHPKRDHLMAALKDRGVGTLIHYPVPIHLQTPFRERGHREGELPITEAAAAEILSLPMYVGLTAEEVRYAADALTSILTEAAR